MLGPMHFESFRTWDDTLLAAHHAGEGTLPVVLANGLGGTFTAWQPLVQRFRDRCHFYSWDYRGLYRSARPEDLSTLAVEPQSRDLLALMDHFGIEKAMIAGWSMGVQVALELYRAHPERVAAMMFMNGTYGSPFDTAFRSVWAKYVLPPSMRFMRAAAPLTSFVVHSFARSPFTVPLASQLRLVDPRIDRGVFHGIAHEFARLDMEVYMETLLRIGDHDAGDVLAHVEVPALVIAGDRDMMTPPQVTDRMIHEMPRAELFIVPRGTHYCLIEYPELVGLRVEKFLRDHLEPWPPRPPRARSAGKKAPRT